MVEMVLPGTYIEVRPEGLIVPGRVSVGTVGIVGTAEKGPLDVPTAVGSYLEARQLFGDYDTWIDGKKNELTLVRAVEIANAHGATSMIAVRIGSSETGQTARAASYTLASATGDCVALKARSEGTWAHDVSVQVIEAAEPGFVSDEKHDGDDLTLTHPPVKDARNRVQLFTAATGATQTMEIVYDAAAPTANQVRFNLTDGKMTFASAVVAADKVTASYAVAQANAVSVVLRKGRAEEQFTVVSGTDLVAELATSQWVTGEGLANKTELPTRTPQPATLGSRGGDTTGRNGEASGTPRYKAGLDLLLNEDAHIIIGAGQDDGFGDELGGHCQLASTDTYRRDRIGIVGAATTDVNTLRGHNLNNDRLVVVAPGIHFTDAAALDEDKADVVLPAAYTAAAVAGLLSSNAPHVSLTNKVLSVGEIEVRYTLTQLTQLVQARILAVEARQGFRVVKGITTSTNTAWHQITTRRIVDFAKFGVRSAAGSYIGLLNNDRVRTALRSTIVSFLNEMVADEMLISYELDVTATREDQRKGIVQVTMILRPTFSIDFIKVTMFLE
jgi:hypothetical protein